MPVKLNGKKRDVEAYRKVLEKRGILTQRFIKMFTKGEAATKPEGFRLLTGEFAPVYTSTVKMVAGKKGKLQKKEINSYDPEEKLRIKGVANAAIVDRMDEVLDPAGCEIKNFMKNQILLADHAYRCGSSIGLVIEVRIEHDGVHFEAWVGDPKSGPLTELQRHVRSLIAQKILKTVSVGFIPHEIDVPEYDDDWNLLKPAVIRKWELLELSVVAVPCNPDSTFEMRQLSKSVVMLNETFANFKQGLTTKQTSGQNGLAVSSNKSDDSNVVQSLIFDREKYSTDEAMAWALEHEFKAEKIDIDDDSVRIRQRPTDDFKEDSLKTIEIESGVQAVTGRLTKGMDEMDQETANALLEAMKGIGTVLASVNTNMEKSIQMQETVLGKLESSKTADDTPPADPPADPPNDDQAGDKTLAKKLEKTATEIEMLKTILNEMKENQVSLEKSIQLLAGLPIEDNK